MKRIGLGSECDAETAAPGLMDGAEESAHVVIVAVPTFEYRDAASVAQDEGGDVDGVGAAMLAQLAAGPPVDRTASIGAKALDLHDLAAEPLAGRGLHPLARPARIFARQRPGHGAAVAGGRADVDLLYCADHRATAPDPAVGQYLERDADARAV